MGSWEGDRWAFVVEWTDPQSAVSWKYQFMYYADNNTIEMYDIKNRRTFLKRCSYPGLTQSQFYIGATITVFSRQLKVVEYADTFTQEQLQPKQETTLAMVKPDASGANLGKIMNAIARSGFLVGRLKMTQLSADEAREFYAAHKDKGFFPELVAFMSSGPVVAMELLAAGAVAKWRDLIGPTNPAAAKQSAPNSLRALFGTDGTKNAVHGSDSRESAAAEAAFFFKRPHAKTARESACACCIIKPHAVAAGYAGAIIDRLQTYFTVSAAELFGLDRANAMEFYEVYKGVVSEYSAMVDEITSGYFLVLEITDKAGGNPVEPLRQLCGPADPEIARVLRPDSLRAQFGTDKVKNAVHCTDLPEDGPLEVQYFFSLLRPSI